MKTRYGFTLIELMVVVMIMAVAAAAALPSYFQYVVKANRVDAREKLSEVIAEQEKYKIRNRTYATDFTSLGYANSPLLSSDGYYSITASVCDEGTSITICVLVSATPVAGGAQADDGAITLNSRGERTGKWE